MATKQETMKAVFWEGKPFEVAVHETPKPQIVDETDVLVRITTAAICGSDLHVYHGVFGSNEVPYPLGHEAVGIVTEIGSAVTTIKPGDRVVISGAPGTGPGEPGQSLTAPATYFGFGPDFGNLGGCQAEFVRVPFAENSNTLAVLPSIAESGIPDTEFLFIGDIFTTAWACLNFSGFQPGDSVAIFGAGPVGLMAAYGALLRGASKVYSIDHVAARLEKAKSIGAIPIDLTQGDGPAAQILALEPKGVQRACDCIGMECVNQQLKPQEDYVINEAVKLLSAFGGFGVVGVYEAEPSSKGAPLGDSISPTISFPITTFWAKELSMTAGVPIFEDIAPALIELVNSGRARPGFIVSAVLDLDDAPEGYRRFSDHLETKVIFRFPDGKY